MFFHVSVLSSRKAYLITQQRNIFFYTEPEIKEKQLKLSPTFRCLSLSILQ